MPDNLRDRIAAALYERHYRLDGRPSDLTFDDLEPAIRDVYLSDADAVIAALGLKKDSEMALDDDYRVVPMHRYVTEWTDGI